MKFISYKNEEDAKMGLKKCFWKKTLKLEG